MKGTWPRGARDEPVRRGAHGRGPDGGGRRDRGLRLPRGGRGRLDAWLVRGPRAPGLGRRPHLGAAPRGLGQAGRPTPTRRLGRT
ncbi:hypothetical protein SSBG_05294 [Streptomyces sp. SPB074]|nr:hypothetical protein SSBG_05294 [Streptomyces sp. SPB074]